MMSSQNTSAESRIRRLVSDNGALPEGTGPGGSKAPILNAALRLFALHGFSGASVRDIAEASGLKPARLYAHFRGKEEILSTLIEIGHEYHYQCLHDAVLNSDNSPTQQLKALVAAHVGFHAGYPMLAILVNHELHALERSYIVGALTLREKSVELMLGIIKRGEANGEFDVQHDPWLAAAAIGAMGMRVANWYSEHHEKSVDEVISAYQDFVMRMVGVKSH